MRERMMGKVMLVVLCVAIFSMSSFAQAETEESFSVKKGSISIITVEGMNVAFYNDESGDCGTFYIIDPATRDILVEGEILDYTYLFINEDRVNMHCVFSAAGTKKNLDLESRPLIVIIKS